MSIKEYKKKTWKKGDVLSPTALNNMEKGIAQLTEEVIKIGQKLESLEKRIDSLEDDAKGVVEYEPEKEEDKEKK